jgi:hypothetical protein
MPRENNAGAKGANGRDDERAMSGQPMHDAILGAAPGAANVILLYPMWEGPLCPDRLMLFVVGAQRPLPH